MTTLSNIVRSKGDPKVLETGPSSLSWPDRLARNLGWFSIGLGALELCAPRTLTRSLGMQGMEPLLRTYGARELASGVLSLSADKKVGLWSRVVGDGVDIATLMPALHPFNPRRSNAKLAMVAVIGVALLDLYAANAVSSRQSRRSRARTPSYKERSGFPQGVEAARGAARDGKVRRSSEPATSASI
jgi:hypothetical protein